MITRDEFVQTVTDTMLCTPHGNDPVILVIEYDRLTAELAQARTERDLAASNCAQSEIAAAEMMRSRDAAREQLAEVEENNYQLRAELDRAVLGLITPELAAAKAEVSDQKITLAAAVMALNQTRDERDAAQSARDEFLGYWTSAIAERDTLRAELAQARALVVDQDAIRVELAHWESGEEYERMKRVAERDGLQALAQYARAQKAEDANAKLRADVIELREMLGNILNTLEMNMTGIEIRDLLGRAELRKYYAILEAK